ncbi:hypothetical protein [Aquella oligotrophica]|uniref:EamA domain-containing protein n=1 Tax=Aquella oligotrophica TaxID=2067065 RepID=A0A2I7N463_9NEIS|nr:hypothetical protein [Aquella oligotrophica]AUR51244.1 hypothetical protein CUN60_02665 [Aquella oligotrophica]
MIYLILFLAFNAIAPIIIYFWGQDINHDILIFISAATAIISFHLLNFRKNKQTYVRIIKDKSIWAGITKVIATTTFMWIAGFIIPITYTPFIFVFSYLGWPSFFGAVVMATTTRKPVYIIQSIMIAITFILFYFVTFNKFSLIKASIGILVTMLTGLSLYLYLRSSKGLNNKGMNSRQILALRYWLLLILPLALIIYRHEFHLFTTMIVLKGVIIGMITLVLPLYFGQLCIEKFGSEKFSLAMGFTPILTFTLQFIMLKAELVAITIAMSLAIAIAFPLLASKAYSMKALRSKAAI